MPPYGQHAQSAYLDPGRPEISRQRSNSLPIGLAMMSKEEAGIIFSAAERAHSRRRRTIAFHGPGSNESPLESHEISPFPTTSTLKPSSLSFMLRSPPQSGCTQETDQYMDEDSESLSHVPALEPSSPCQTSPSIQSTHSLLNSFPISPRRRVARPLKGYADGLFSFTQSLLNSTIPQVQTSSPPPVPFIYAEEPTTSSEDAGGRRPMLQSHFSAWSESTQETGAGMLPNSWRTSFDPNSSDFDFGLMSPDSFFGEAQTTPRFGNSIGHNARRESSGYASSGTYEPPTSFPASTPQSRGTKFSTKDDFSYFSDFSQFCDRNGRPDSLVIDLSPIEAIRTPRTPPPALGQRADTAIRDPVPREPVIVSSCTASGTPGSGSMISSPHSPLEHLEVQTADVAVRVPNWLIGAIG